MEKIIDCHSYDFVTLPKTSILVADRLGDASYWLDEVSSYFEEAHIAKNCGQHPADSQQEAECLSLTIIRK